MRIRERKGTHFFNYRFECSIGRVIWETNFTNDRLNPPSVSAQYAVHASAGTATGYGRSPCQSSNFRLLGELESIVNLDTEIANRTLQLRVSEQQLDGAQILGTPINQRSFDSP